MKRYRVGIIGCGCSAWELHGYLLRDHPRFCIAAAYDRKPDVAVRYAQAFNCMAYETLEDFLKADLDLAVILTVSSMHAELAVLCMEHGIHTFVTKPWACSVGEADAMIAAAAKNGVQVYEVLAQQFENDLRLLKDIVSGGAIGRVYRVRRNGATFGQRNDWQTQLSLGGGYLNNWGPHLFGQALALLSEPVVRVCAETRRIINGGDAEDMFVARLITNEGTILDVEYNIMTEGVPDWIIQGDGGTVTVKDHVIELHRVEQPEKLIEGVYRNKVRIELERIPYQPVDRHVLYDELAEALDGTKPYSVQPAFSRMITEIISAARVSAQNGMPVILDKRSE